MFIVGGSLWLLGAGVVQAELWRCVDKAGGEVFTNDTERFSGCTRQELRSELGFVSVRGQAAPAPTVRSRTERTAGKGVARARAKEQRSPTSTKPPAGEMAFEALRMLSTGMTKAEVLSRAGHPRHEFKNRGTQRWIYSSSDRWIVEIVFSGNHVIAVNWSRA